MTFRDGAETAYQDLLPDAARSRRRGCADGSALTSTRSRSHLADASRGDAVAAPEARSRRRPSEALALVGASLSRPLEGSGEDRRLRRDRRDARPAPGGCGGRRLEGCRVGPPRGVRHLRARPGAATARARARPLPGGRGVLLVRAGRPRRPRPADRAASNRTPSSQRRARRSTTRSTRSEERIGSGPQSDVSVVDELGDHRLPRGARGRAHPGGAHGEPRRRAATVPPADVRRRRSRARRERGHLGRRPDRADVARSATARSSRRSSRSSRSACCS